MIKELQKLITKTTKQNQKTTQYKKLIKINTSTKETKKLSNLSFWLFPKNETFFN